MDNIDKAKKFLKANIQGHYEKYIDTKLAGDFAADAADCMGIEGSQRIVCPFCHEGGFDHFNLKHHLYDNCKKFREL